MRPLARPYLQHARRHLARGSDPTPSEWHELELLNGCTNQGAPKPNARWRFRSYVDPDTLDPSFEIELAVTIPTPGLKIAQLPFTLSEDKPTKAGWDVDADAARAYTVLADGSIMDGVA